MLLSPDPTPTTQSSPYAYYPVQPLRLLPSPAPTLLSHTPIPPTPTLYASLLGTHDLLPHHP